MEVKLINHQEILTHLEYEVYTLSLQGSPCSKIGGALEITTNKAADVLQQARYKLALAYVQGIYGVDAAGAEERWRQMAPNLRMYKMDKILLHLESLYSRAVCGQEIPLNPADYMSERAYTYYSIYRQGKTYAQIAREQGRTLQSVAMSVRKSCQTVAMAYLLRMGHLALDRMEAFAQYQQLLTEYGGSPNRVLDHLEGAYRQFCGGYISGRRAENEGSGTE